MVVVYINVLQLLVGIKIEGGRLVNRSLSLKPSAVLNSDLPPSSELEGGFQPTLFL